MAVLKRRLLWMTLVVAHTLGIVSSVDALMSTRTAPGAVAWIVSLNTFPYVSVPAAYWVFGANRFNGYVIGRRQGDSRLHRELAQKMSLVEHYSAPFPPSNLSFQVLERLAKMPLLSGNNVRLLVDGEATFANIFAGIDAAEHYLLVQFYIVRDDVLGRELKHRLAARAREGVKVYFLYDEIGSYLLPRRYLDDLRDAGVLDGSGGLNVGDEYLGQDPRIGAWRDTHIKIEGPAVLGLQLPYFEDWYWASGEILDLDWQSQPVVNNGVPILMLPSGPADRFETASLMVQHALATARRRA